jgi:hypothetical protein
MGTLFDLRDRSATTPDLPAARGPVTSALLEHLRRPPHDLPALPDATDDAIDGDDRALALYVMYELHYRSFANVDDGWEWEPSLLRERARLEAAFAARLRERVPPAPVSPSSVKDELVALATTGSGPSLSRHMRDAGTVEEMREFAIHRSAYQRKEADPHTWVVPRLTGRSKAALVVIQRGEYGNGSAAAAHSELFATTMEALDLDPTYGAYLDRIPGTTLATVNLMSFFGLHRRWRGALVGHLALFEMSSVVPMGRYRDALHRLGAGEGAPFYAVHVEADAHHEVIALHDMAGALAAEEPDLAADIVFGARALEEVERAFATRLLTAWAAGKSSLLPLR